MTKDIMGVVMVATAVLLGFLITLISGEIALNQPIYRQKRPSIGNQLLSEIRMMRKIEARQ